MSKTSIQKTPATNGIALQPEPLANGNRASTDELSNDRVAVRRAKSGPIRRLFQAAASLRLTVLLFALSIVLIFSGTLAQLDAGIGTVVKEYFRSLYVWIPLQLFVRFGQVFFGVPPLTRVNGAMPFPGGWLIGGLLLLNLLAAHAVRFRLSWKRSGILLLHSGLVVLMAGELLTGLFAVEGQMTIPGGGASNVIKHRERPEFAVTGPLDTAADEETVVPASILRKGGVIRNAQLPFDVEVDEFMPNSHLAQAAAGSANRATAGEGLRWQAEPSREGTGVDSEQRIDLASAYVTLKKKDTGESLGTYLVSDWLSEIPLIERPEQKVTVDGKTYGIALRFQRQYTPYTFQLLEFHHDNYPGTDIPNNFSSEIRILDPEQHVDRQVNIHMNVPLRYQRSSDEPWWQLLVRGQETFYQQGFLDNDSGTILQVVRNPGWLAPYFACAMVAGGMVLHFGITLFGFLRKRQFAAAGRVNSNVPSWLLPAGMSAIGLASAVVFLLYMTGYYLPAAAGFLAVYGAGLVLLHGATRGFGTTEEADGFARYFPWMVVVTAGLLVLVAMMPPHQEDGQPDLQKLATLPVQAEGRVKPLDTVARVALAGISDLQTFKNVKGQTRPAIEWLIDVMTSQLPKNERPSSPLEYKVFRIENDQLLTLLGLQRREGLRYALEEFRDKIDELAKQTEQADSTPEKERSVYQTKVLELAHKIHAYQQLTRLATPRLIPPEKPRPNADWRTLPQVASEIQASGQDDPPTIALFATLQAYAKNKPNEFNENLDKYRGYLAAKFPAEMSKADFETFFNQFAPFYVCVPLYVGVFALSALSWLGWSRPLNRAAFWLAVLALVVHTFGLATRMYLQGRPPVTNLYSSAVFIGWMSVLLGLALEVVFGLGIGNALAGAMGFAGVVIAHNLASGDTLEMMRAVLDTNFWLATHVICVSTGYAATMFAGFLGILYILAGVFTRSDDRGWGRGIVGVTLAALSAFVGLVALVIARGKAYKSLTLMLYGILCFATLFSFVGTVLGGIWADQSWGRFWGWDPKENGALLIVIMNALILHARWSGLVKDRGMAVLAVCGNIITGWSWFGTNQLGVGLHSYGFTSGLALTLTLFWASQALMICLGLVPMRYWRGADDIRASAVAATRGNLGTA
jgi:ABC-type transport system involved in cytochrome c biogenesis permease subunit